MTMGAGELSLQVGSVFQDRYEVLSELGAGTFGRVYKARQLSTGQHVAIKTLRVQDARSSAATRVQAERFRREMRICAGLLHPHIVRLIDFGDLGEHLLYAVFEFVPGHSLREVIAAGGKLEMADALRLMMQTLDALSCAHAQGIVHRDLKPENIMVTRTGVKLNAKILDFGLGGLTAGAHTADLPRLTATREMLGTPCYAAPEQLRGGEPSPRSDLYSWGLVFLECLTGEVVVGGSSAHEVLLKQLGPDPVPVPDWLRTQRLGRLLQAVTVKDVEQRNVTIAGLLESLEAIERDVSVVRAAGACPAPGGEGERRQLTIVSCRSTVTGAGGEAVDVEDLDQVLRAQYALLGRLAREHEGTVISEIGDRALLTFGLPRVRENDARRAVRLALRVVAESRSASAGLERERGLRVCVHVGVDSGVVIVRDDTEGRPPGGFQVVGTSRQVAIRLDESAGPGDVLVSSTTQRLLRDEMESEPAGEVRLPDSSARVQVFRVTGERPLELSDQRTETPLINRAQELEQLVGTWRLAQAGEARAILVAGEPGMGKSRLLRELRKEVPRNAWLECRCVADNQASPLRPIVDLLTALPEPVDKAMLARLGLDVGQTLPLFSSLLSRPLDETVAPLRLPPDRRKELTLAAIAELLVQMTKDRPHVLCMEDVHWADPTTLEFLNVLIEDMRAARVGNSVPGVHLCVALTARPEFLPPWPVTDCGVDVLNRLGRSDVEALVSAGLPSGEQLPEAVVGRIVARTDGVPLFVEEMTHAFVRATAESSQSGASQTVEWGSEIPGTLRELLTAQLDLLSSSARRTVQVMAALGRDLDYDVLHAVAQKDDWLLRQDVRELTDAQLLYGLRRTRLVFRHSLIRDAAYESMVRSVKRQVHGRIARVLREQFPKIGEQQPERLAEHFEAAGEIETAVDYWHRAGDRALRRAAYAEATGHLQRGLSAVMRIPASAERSRVEIELLTTLGTVLFSTRGYADTEVETTFAEALSLCRQLGEGVSEKVLSGVVGVYITRGDRAATEELLPQFERLARRTEDVVACVTGCATVGQVLFWRGEHEAAREYLEQGRTVYLTEEFQQFARGYGYDGGVFTCIYRMWNLWALGCPDQAEAACAELARIADRSFDPYTLPLTLAFRINLAHAQRDAEETQRIADRLVELSTEQKLYLWLAAGLCGKGAALALAGRGDEAIDPLRQGLDLSRAIGSMTGYSYFLTYLAEAHLVARRIGEGLAVIDEGLALCGRSLGRFHEPELERLKGELLRLDGDAAGAAASFHRALTLARRGGARSWELRAASSLARLSIDGGARGEGRSVLQAVYDSFSEGFERPDLRDARRLLAESD
jgi:TOMM system kinase/cyclase fusion protein